MILVILVTLVNERATIRAKDEYGTYPRGSKSLVLLAHPCSRKKSATHYPPSPPRRHRPPEPYVAPRATPETMSNLQLHLVRDLTYPPPFGSVWTPSQASPENVSETTLMAGTTRASLCANNIEQTYGLKRSPTKSPSTTFESNLYAH